MTDSFNIWAKKNQMQPCFDNAQEIDIFSTSFKFLYIFNCKKKKILIVKKYNLQNQQAVPLAEKNTTK